MDYLLERDVNLFIGHPQVVGPSEQVSRELKIGALSMLRFTEPDPTLIGREVIHIPLLDGWRLLAIYLSENPMVEAAIQAGRWETSIIVAD